MRYFEHPNMTNFICPICRTSADMPVLLVPFKSAGDGLNECNQVHKKCYELIVEMKAKG